MAILIEKDSQKLCVNIYQIDKIKDLLLHSSKQYIKTEKQESDSKHQIIERQYMYNSVRTLEFSSNLW